MTESRELLFTITLVLYFGAAVLYLWSLAGASVRRSRFAAALMALGLAAHTAGMIIIGIEQHRMPFTNLFESLMFGTWVLVAIYLVLEIRYCITALGAYVGLASSIAVILGSALPKDVSISLLPALRSHWSSVHITSCLIGYAGFAMAFGAAVCYALQEHLLKTKRINTLQKRLPSLDAMDHLAYKMVALGFPMLTLGIVTGSLWAQTAWGSYWNWDPKETWSLITWLVYAAYLHVRIVQGRRGRWSNRLLIAGFACILITFFPLNFISSGLHKYSW